VWTVEEYVLHPVHVSDLQRAIRTEDGEKAVTSPLETKKRPKTVPKSCGITQD
jgi:hypothetical protein